MRRQRQWRLQRRWEGRALEAVLLLLLLLLLLWRSERRAGGHNWRRRKEVRRLWWRIGGPVRRPMRRVRLCLCLRLESPCCLHVQRRCWSRLLHFRWGVDACVDAVAVQCSGWTKRGDGHNSSSGSSVRRSVAVSGSVEANRSADACAPATRKCKGTPRTQQWQAARNRSQLAKQTER